MFVPLSAEEIASRGDDSAQITRTALPDYCNVTGHT